MGQRKPIPRKSLTQVIKEEELDVIGRAELKGANRENEKAEAVKKMTREQKDQLLDFIFGVSEYNPLESFNKKGKKC